MEYAQNRQLGRAAVRGQAREEALAKRAHQLAPLLVAGTRRKTGETAGSTHVEANHHAADGRPAVRIVQRNVSVPLNFRLDRDYMIRSIGGS